MTTCKENQQLWNDVYIRSNFADVGCYPTEGSLSHSPDVIPAGENAVADPNIYISNENWGKDYGGNTWASLPNYIYVRGMNLGAKNTEGRVYLYYSPGSLILWPVDPVDPTKGWSKTGALKTSKGSNYFTFAVDAGKRLVTTDPFLWVPVPISGDHYCMIGRITTPNHENPIPAVGTITGWAEYISEHPNMSWRNVTTINPAHPISSRTLDYAQGDEGGETIINLKAYKTPIGSKISFSAGTTTGVSPPIVRKPQTVDNAVLFSASVTSNIDAGYSTLITYSWYSEGQAPLPGMKIELDAILPQGKNDPLYDRAVDLRALGVSEDVIRQHSGNGVGPKKGIRLGSASMELPIPPSGALRPGQVIAEPRRASMLVKRVAWAEQDRSIFGSSLASKSVSISSEENDPDEIQKVIFDEKPGSPSSPTQETDVNFNTGTVGGSVFVYIKTKNVPVGAEVSFDGGTKTYPIRIPKRTVDNQNSFTTGNYFELPAELETSIAAHFYQNDHNLPDEESSLELGAILVGTGGVPFVELGISAADLAQFGGDPGSGTLLGKVITYL